MIEYEVSRLVCCLKSRRKEKRSRKFSKKVETVVRKEEVGVPFSVFGWLLVLVFYFFDSIMPLDLV